MDEYREVLGGSFGLALTDEELRGLAEKGINMRLRSVRTPSSNSAKTIMLFFV